MKALRPYQEEAVDFLAAAGRAIYADGPGTGKTIGTLEVIRRWKPANTLIVVPVLQGAGILNWQRTIRDQLEVTTHIAYGVPATRLAAYKEWARRGGICVVGYESMRSDIDNIYDVGADALVADEAHRLVNRNAKTTKAFRQLAGYADKLLLVTATPMVNEADDLWSLFNLIDRKTYSSYWRWVHQHCTTNVTDFGGKLQRPVELVKGLLPGADEQIRAQLEPVLMQRPISELLPDISTPTEEILAVELSPQERRHYQELKRKYVTELDGEQIIALNEVSKITRLRQLTSDWSSVFAEVGAGAKVLAAAELVGDISEQVVVMCAFQATCDRLVEQLTQRKVPAVAYHGGTERSPQALEDFIQGKTRVLVGTLGSLGESVDGLQVARILVLVDRPWNPKGYDQAVGRVRRSGQENDVVVYHVVAHETIDERVAEALVTKRDVAEALGFR